jgi:antitoxin component of MazEF toxin-antitoxin module
MNYSLEKTKIRRIGNGRGILLSKSLCNLIGVEIDDRFRIELDQHKIVLVPIRNPGDENG